MISVCLSLSLLHCQLLTEVRILNRTEVRFGKHLRADAESLLLHLLQDDRRTE